MASKNGHAPRVPAPKRTATTFGELVALVFEQALAITADHREAARLASQVIEQLLRGGRQRDLLAQLSAN